MQLTDSHFRKHLLSESWYSSGLKILVACSGGPDSSALLQLLHNTGLFELEVVHLNHGLRGSSASQDAKFVADQAQSLGLVFHLLAVDIQEHARSNGLSVEEAGSLIRKQKFLALAQERDCQFLATGQHLGDQLESLFMNLYVGSGIEGLSGISSRNGNIIRPLLWVSRLEIVTYLDQSGLKYRNDESNTDTQYLRNLIRHQLLPELEGLQAMGSIDLFKHIIRSSQQLITLIRRSVEVDDIIIIRSVDRSKISLGMSKLPDYFSPIKKVFFDSAFRDISGAEQGLSNTHFRRILQLLKAENISKSIQLAGGIEVIRDRYQLTFYRPEMLRWNAFSVLSDPLHNSTHFRVHRTQGNPIMDLMNPDYFWDLCSEKEHEMRMIEAGDEMVVDETGRSLPVLQLLQEAHVAPHFKKVFPVMLHQDKIVWVPGVRTAFAAKVAPAAFASEHQKHCIKIEFDKGIFE